MRDVTRGTTGGHVASAGPAPAAWWAAAVVTIVATAYAGYNAWAAQEGRTYPLDVDGWGHLVVRQQNEGRGLDVLFSAPSLWKGPVVPFVFGLVYYVSGAPEAVLAFNALAFGIAAGVFVVGFTRLGAQPWVAVAACLAWVGYVPLRHLFGYYFAEPLLSLLVALLFLGACQTVLRRSPSWALVSGILAGLLLLSRAPFVLLVLGLPVVMAVRVRETWARIALCYGIGLLVTFCPWGIRNWIVFREAIPFTTEGGKILFQGTYLPGDDMEQNALRRMPEYVAIEREERGKSEIERYRYWKALAMAQAREDVAGQARLVVRKAIRFWAYMPQHGWVPAWKTGLVALLTISLGTYGALVARRSLLGQLCVLSVCGLWAFHALIHAELRYNFPVLPIAFLLAALGVGSLGWRMGLWPHDGGRLPGA